jgi:hypothetical protein
MAVRRGVGTGIRIRNATVLLAASLKVRSGVGLDAGA